MSDTIIYRTACGAAVMAKASQPGRTKTRLVPPLTSEEASQLNTVFLKDIAANLIAASQQADITGYMAYAPPGAGQFFSENLPQEIIAFEAWAPEFGDCLISAIQSLFDRGHHIACVLNSDSPTLPVSLLSETIRLLRAPGERVVLGPSTDGGYYLMGLTKLHARLFEDIDWSTERVAGQTLERAAEIGLEVALLPLWYDVDDGACLRRLIDELFHGMPFDPALTSSPAVHTAAFLETLLSDERTASRLGIAPLARARAAS